MIQFSSNKGDGTLLYMILKNQYQTEEEQIDIVKCNDFFCLNLLLP